jgi:diacylglycerol kinase (ATP)
MSGPFCLVVNPAAGQGRSLRVLRTVTAALDAADAAYHASESSSLDDARDIARRAAQQGEVVVAVGGDGTAGALAGVVASADGRYGLIPAGRGNDIARVLGIPADPASAAQVLLGAQARHVDLIAVSAPGHPETAVVGSVYAGIPSIAGEIANQSHWLPGPLHYPVAALRALAGWTPATFRAEIRCASDAPGAPGAPGARGARGAIVREFPGYAIVVANVAYFGAGMQVAPPAVIDDGVLDIVIMRDGPKLAFLRALARIRSGTHLRLPQISVDRGTEVVLSIDRDMLAAADGEALPCAAPLRAGTQLRIRVLPGVLTVLAPS